MSTVGTSAGGVALLAAYALGLGIPFLAAALFLDRAAPALRRMRRLGVALQLAGGLVLVAFGIAMITGYVSVIALWMLDAFPALGRVG